MRLTFEMCRAIARALTHKCNAGRGSCPAEGDCPFDVPCVDVQTGQWLNALGCINVKKVKRKKEDVSDEE